MKIRRFMPLVVLSLLFACAPKKPELPATEAPAAPLIHALEERRDSFRSLKAVASAQVSRKGRTRTFESVGVLIEAQDRFKLEAYGPLGQPLIELLWNGKEVLLRSLSEPGLRTPKGGLDRLLGADVEPRELCAVLSGTVPNVADYDARAFCDDSGCVLDLRRGETLRRLRVAPPTTEGGPGIRLFSSELVRGTALVYHADYEDWETVSGYLFPRKIELRNPERKTGLVVEYQDFDVNTPLDDSVFTLSGGDGADR